MATFGTFTSGQVLTASELNEGLPSCVLTATGISVPASTNTYVAYSSEDHDPFGWHSTVTNTTRITPNIAGWYLCTATVNDLNPLGGNYRVINIVRRNLGSGLLDVEFARFDANNYGPDDVSVSGVTYCNGTTDYLEHLVFQGSVLTQTARCQLTVTRISG